MCALQALQDILDDDDDIGSMYLSRKARAKQRSQTATSQAETAAKHGGDDEVLVAHAEEVCAVNLNLLSARSYRHTRPLPLSEPPASASCILCWRSPIYRPLKLLVAGLNT